MNSNSINFDQTLHGYIDGHTLIASSIELPSEVKRIMLLLSDMSGSRMEKGFEEYITGYPIKEINMYAMAKTWYAPEMKRPGCVWTHTLLMDFQDVPKIANVQKLLSLFVRPEILELNKELYLRKLAVNTEINDFNPVSTNLLDQQTRSLLKNLYNDADKSLLVRSSTAENFEELILMIWRQQWPRLKRNFSFCTGAIFPRNIKGDILDLQIIPNSSEKFPSIMNEINVMDLNESKVDTSENWLNFITTDLFSPSIIAHNFLNYFGSDVSIKRKAFKALIECYIFFSNEKPILEKSISFLATQYPSPKEASNLKNSLLNRVPTSFGNILPLYDETAILYHLTITEYYKNFDYEKLNYKTRFISLFQNLDEQSVKTLKSIIRKGPNANGEEVITELAEILSENKYLNSIWSDKQLSSVFIGLNPKLTFSNNFWLTNNKNQIEIINQLKRSNIGKFGWQKILNILLEINSSIDPHVFENQDVLIESAILDYLNKHETTDIGRNWLNYLRNNPAEVLEWFTSNNNIRPKVIELIVILLNPNSNLVLKYGLHSWVEFFNQIEKDKRHLVKIDVHVFCVALAFNINNVDAQKIFESSFEIIYFSLATDSLDYNLWKNLEVHTKPLNFWKDWDKCKKIVNAVVDFYVNNNWSINQLLLNIHSNDIKDRILQKYKKRK
ncbi:hypothetical protein [Pedobacter sp. L105]|uniref:GAP1-N1 domain-containing protein n=1 Tax=Pedobacter sp. L105 TaxID=1641871 RepID=UPI00131D1DEB|nr:hypothetical protein [Pedobacter sp. L105]